MMETTGHANCLAVRCMFQKKFGTTHGQFLLVILVPLQLHAFRRFTRYEGSLKFKDEGAEFGVIIQNND